MTANQSSATSSSCSAEPIGLDAALGPAFGAMCDGFDRKRKRVVDLKERIDRLKRELVEAEQLLCKARSAIRAKNAAAALGRVLLPSIPGATGFRVNTPRSACVLHFVGPRANSAIGAEPVDGVVDLVTVACLRLDDEAGLTGHAVAKKGIDGLKVVGDPPAGSPPWAKSYYALKDLSLDKLLKLAGVGQQFD